MKSVRLFVNDNEESRNVSKIVKEKLEIANFQIVEDNYDLAIAIGGDGSFLRMIKSTHFNENCLYIGINAGTLGFAQEVNVEEIDKFILDLKNQKFFFACNEFWIFCFYFYKFYILIYFYIIFT